MNETEGSEPKLCYCLVYLLQVHKLFASPKSLAIFVVCNLSSKPYGIASVH